MLGDMVWLYSKSELHRDWPLRSINAWLLPAIQHDQCRIYYRNARPIGFVSWAFLSDEVQQSYVKKTSSLRPDQWRSGDNFWLLDLVAPFGDAKLIINDLRSGFFSDKIGYFLRDKPGRKALTICHVHGKSARGKDLKAFSAKPVLTSYS
jgi:cytolysin-activating lysine-acyltransferase